MQERIVLQPAFVLHARPFRETSLLVDLLTRDYGRVSAVARGARAQQSRYRGFLRPFVPILVSWSGRSELMSMNQVEQNGAPLLLEGRTLLAGMYLNELLVRLLHQYDPHPEIFENYFQALEALNQNSTNIEVILRQFEKGFLAAVGFGFSWIHTIDTLAPILATREYGFDPDQGFIEKIPPHNQPIIFNGSDILAIAHNQFENPNVLRTAKKIMRLALQLRLGSKTLKSRELFI